MIPIEDCLPTLWLRDRFLSVSPGRGVLVGAIVPTGFDAYCRIFHPAYRYLRETGQHQVVRWSEVATSNGKIYHPLMHWHNIMGRPESPRFHDPEWGTAPSFGELDPSEVGRVAEVLEEHTETPERCYFGFWEGSYHEKKVSEPVEIGEYKYLIFRGGLEEAPAYDSPNLWWPGDHAWFVATDIDSFYTLVGGSTECIADFLAHSDLEALPVRVDDRIGLQDDTINV